jgi:hypothetical protein
MPSIKAYFDAWARLALQVETCVRTVCHRFEVKGETFVRTFVSILREEGFENGLGTTGLSPSLCLLRITLHLARSTFCLLAPKRGLMV